MTSSPNEPKEDNAKFTFWDWLVIFIVSDMGSSGLVTLVSTASLTPAIWFIIVAVAGWTMHEWNVREDIKRGIR